MSETIWIERATTSAAVELAYVAAVTFPLACPPHLPREDMALFIVEHLSPARFMDYIADPSSAVFVARTADGPIGYALVKTGPPNGDADYELADGLVMELSKMYVLPGHHGGGAATQLMQAAQDHARSARAVALWLGVNALNERAQRFYRKSGFRQAGVRTFAVGSRLENDYILAVNLLSN